MRYCTAHHLLSTVDHSKNWSIISLGPSLTTGGRKISILCSDRCSINYSKSMSLRDPIFCSWLSSPIWGCWSSWIEKKRRRNSSHIACLSAGLWPWIRMSKERTKEIGKISASFQTEIQSRRLKINNLRAQRAPKILYAKRDSVWAIHPILKSTISSLWTNPPKTDFPFPKWATNPTNSSISKNQPTRIQIAS